jgi:hypothetical protein
MGKLRGDLYHRAFDLGIASVRKAQQESAAITASQAELRQRDEPLTVRHDCEAFIVEVSSAY